jgi:dipeptidyl aminopeptidase/acylaminoacyl peptidase
VRRAVDSRAVDHSGEIGATRLPLVVDIHGGPHVSANVWGYDREVQFFASRGYAVLQPQFRGTGGFGLKHLTSSYREWGLAMQDDLEDGVRWAVEEGIADARRACYYGGSYGGFAAIVGTIKSAGIVRCAVAVAAPTSIDYLFDSNETDLSRLADRSTLMQSYIGDPHTDRARWKSINPVDNADKVSAPILLAYGIADVRVPLAHGNDFRSALDRFHKPYEWVTYGGEGHGFNSDENVFDFYHRVDQFLAKYLNDGESHRAVDGSAPSAPPPAPPPAPPGN